MSRPPHANLLQRALQIDESSNETQAYTLYSQCIAESSQWHHNCNFHQNGSVDGQTTTNAAISFWSNQLNWISESVEILRRMQHIALKEMKRAEMQQKRVSLNVQGASSQIGTSTSSKHQRNLSNGSSASVSSSSNNHDVDSAPAASNEDKRIHKDFSRFSSTPTTSMEASDLSTSDISLASNASSSPVTSSIAPVVRPESPPHAPFSAKKPPSQRLKKTNPLKYFRELAEYQEIQQMDHQKQVEKQRMEREKMVRDYKRTWRSTVKETGLFQWDYTRNDKSSSGGASNSLSTSSYGKSSLFYKQRPQKSFKNNVSWQEFIQDKFCTAYERMDEQLMLNDYRWLLEVRQMEQDLLLLENTIQDMRGAESNDKDNPSTYQALSQEEDDEFAPVLDGRVQEQRAAIEDHIENHLNSLMYQSEHALNIVMSDFTQKFLIMRTLEMEKDDSDANPKRQIDSYYCEIMINEGKDDILEFMEKLIYTLYSQYWGRISTKESTHVLEVAERKSFVYIENYLFSMGIYKRLMEFYSNLDEISKKNDRIKANLKEFRRKNATLKHLATPHTFQLSESKHPYKKAVEMLQYFSEFPTVKGKLTVLTECLHQIPKDAREYWKKRSQNESEPLMNADDLIPVFCFLVIWSGVNDVFSHLQFVSDFVDEREIMSETGYALTTFESVCEYLLRLEWDTMQMEYHRMLQEDETHGRSTVEDMITFDDNEAQDEGENLRNLEEDGAKSKMLQTFATEHISEAEVSDVLADLDECIDEDTLNEFM